MKRTVLYRKLHELCTYAQHRNLRDITEWCAAKADALVFSAPEGSPLFAARKCMDRKFEVNAAIIDKKL